MSIGGIWHVITGPDPNMSVYYLALWAWTHIFGYSEFALRSLGVALGWPAVPLIIAVGTRLFDRRTGLIAGLFLAVSPCFVIYEQTARSYGILVTLTLLSTWCFLRARDYPTGGRLAAYGIVSIVAFYTHYFFALVLLVHLCVLLVDRRRVAHPRGWLMAAGVICVGAIPEVLLAAAHPQNTSWISSPPLSAPIRLLGFLLAGDYRHHATRTGAVIVLLCVLFAAASMLQIAEASSGRDRSSTAFLLGWLLIPVILTFAESKVGQPLWINYYLIIVLPAFTLLAASGLSSLSWTSAVAAGVVVVTALQVVQLHRVVTIAQFEDWRDAARFVVASSRTTDQVIYPAEQRFGPQFTSASPGMTYYERLTGAHVPTQTTITRLLADRSPPSRVWLVLRTDEGSPNAQIARATAALRSRYVQRVRRTFASTATVVLYLRKRS